MTCEDLGAQSGGLGAIPERGMGGLLDETLQVFRSNFWQFVAIAAIPVIANVLANVFFSTGDSPLVLLGFVFILVSIVLSVVTAGAIVFGVARHYVRGGVDVMDCLSHAFQVAVLLVAQAIVVMLIVGGILIIGGLMFGVGLVITIGDVWGGGDSGDVGGILIGLGALALLVGIVVAIWLGVRWFSASYAVVIEGKGPIAGLGRSWNLVTGSWWRVFGIGVVFAIIIIVVVLIISVPIGIAGGLALGEEGAAIVGGLIGAVVTVIVTPFGYIAGTLLYFDLRVRKEGFDLDQLAAETGGRP